jgi:hypothetical protein
MPLILANMPKNITFAMNYFNTNDSRRIKTYQYIGIDRMVMTIDPKTRKEVMRPLYEAATTHTARKTFIGNLHKQVKDPNLIASMSGHTEGSCIYQLKSEPVY